MERQRELAGLIASHAPRDGIYETALPRVRLFRSSQVTEPLQTLYEPSCCIVAQGRKRATIGDVEHLYDASTYLVVGVDLPVIGAVVEASGELPYLCLQLELDRPALAEMLLRDGVNVGTGPAFGVSEATPELLDAAVRLLRLLDSPEEAGVLAPLFEREILYRLVRGPRGELMRQIASSESRLSRINRCIGFLRENFCEPATVADLAAIAGMSPSSFFQHFRAVTSMSPLQFRTRIRLQEARRLMVTEGITAAEAGFRVGYESPSQFSRDYTRVHHRPPRQDVARLREMTLAGLPADLANGTPL